MRRIACLGIAASGVMAIAMPGASPALFDAIADKAASPHASRTVDASVFMVDIGRAQVAGERRSRMRLCRNGARWIRPEFDQLTLRGEDRLLLIADSGDRVELMRPHAQRGRLDTRALRGNCIELRPEFSDPASRYALRRYQFGIRELASVAQTVVAAGDICDSVGTACMSTSDTVLSIAPNAVALLGDNAYEAGALSEYEARYHPSWGRFKSITFPTPGNHEYGTAGAAGYFDYFNGAGVQSGQAGERGKGYYSWNIGEWHFVALNSNFSSGSTSDVTQLSWLRSDLAANTRPCTAAYFHHPLVTVGRHSSTVSMRPYWDALAAVKADLILVGHDHNYQRYGKMTSAGAPALDGIRQVLVGTGGRAFYGLTRTHPVLEAADASSHGVLKLTLTANSYEGSFVASAGGAFSDDFRGRCNRAVIAETIRAANCRLSPLPAALQGK